MQWSDLFISKRSPVVQFTDYFYTRYVVAWTCTISTRLNFISLDVAAFRKSTWKGQVNWWCCCRRRRSRWSVDRGGGLKGGVKTHYYRKNGFLRLHFEMRENTSLNVLEDSCPYVYRFLFPFASKTDWRASMETMTNLHHSASSANASLKR